MPLRAACCITAAAQTATIVCLGRVLMKLFALLLGWGWHTGPAGRDCVPPLMVG